MDLYINNLAPSTIEEQLQLLFEPFGEVSGIKMNRKSFTKMNKANAVLSMKNRGEAVEAMNALNHTSFNGKKITVNEALPRL